MWRGGTLDFVLMFASAIKLYTFFRGLEDEEREKIIGLKCVIVDQRKFHYTTLRVVPSFARKSPHHNMALK